MNLSKSASESTYSSCNSKENGVASTESDRPLKKARFAWEVKGKYHLKNDISDNKSETSTPDGSDAGSSLETERECKDLSSNIQTNLDIVGDLLEQELCTLDSEDKSDQQQLSISSISQENISSLQYTDDEEDYLEYENQSLVVWQQEQMTKCLVENSLNTYYESTRGTLQQNLSSDRRIEDEGILMAISTHGLHNTSSSSDYDTDNPSVSPASSIHPEEHLYSNESLDERLCKQSRNLSSYLIRSQSYTDNIEINNKEYDKDNNCYNIDTKTHYDFLDTAVSFAIQYKGLTSHGTDYG